MTVGQILEVRHFYRGIEAHTITVLAVYTLFMQVFLRMNRIMKLVSKSKRQLLLISHKQIKKQMRMQMLLNPMWLSYTGD